MDKIFFSPFHSRFMLRWGSVVEAEGRAYQTDSRKRSQGGHVFANFLAKCVRNVSFPSVSSCERAARELLMSASPKDRMDGEFLLMASDNVRNVSSRKIFRGAPAEWVEALSERVLGGSPRYSNYSNSEETAKTFARGGILLLGKLSVDPAQLEHKPLREADELDMEMHRFDDRLRASGSRGFSYPGNSLGELHFRIRNDLVTPKRIVYTLDNDVMDPFVKLLVANMSYSGLKQVEFGESIGMSQPAISKILGYRGGVPKLESIMRMASKIPFEQEIRTLAKSIIIPGHGRHQEGVEGRGLQDLADA